MELNDARDENAAGGTRSPARMTLRETAREIGRVLREYAPSLVMTALVGVGALEAFSALRKYEDHAIQRTLAAEGRYLAAATGEALGARSLQMLELARRWEEATKPDSAAWVDDVRHVAEQDPVYRGFEWRDATLRTVWAEPWLSRRPGGDLDSTFDSARAVAAEVAATTPAGSISSSFPGAGGVRYLVIATPLLRNGMRVGTMAALVRARDLFDDILLPQLQRGFTLAVREGPYQLYGATVVNEGYDAAIDWWTTVPVRAGDLHVEIDFWPTPELMAKMRSRAPGLVLLVGLILALALGSLARTAQLAARRR